MRKHHGQILIIVGILLITYWSLHAYLRQQALQAPSSSQTAIQSQYSPIWVAVPNRFSLELKPAQIVAGHWNVWPDTVTYLPTESNNLIIYAHNTKSLFADLKKVKLGEQVEIIDSTGETNHYIVQQIAIVKPSDIELLGPTDKPVVTLYTCIGFLDSQRLVVRANRK